MNIFILDPNPIIAASYHCDLHIHKMILESAQMASSAVGLFGHLPDHIRNKLYKPAYLSHPCTMWASNSPANLAWMVELARELEQIRLSLGFKPHNSSKIINLVHEYLGTKFPISCDWRQHTPFAEAMYARIKIRQDMDTVQKYRHYYRIKLNEWGLTGAYALQYKDRSVPPFLTDQT